MKLHPSSLKELYIQWDIIGDVFTVYRSTSPEGEFAVIGEDIDQSFFVDETANLYDDNVRYYYRVSGYVSGEKVSEDGPVTLQYNSVDKIAGKVIYESRVVLRVMNNPPVFFLIKKRVGSECPECWNAITKKVRYSGCLICNGTGIVEGYHQPIKTRISQDVSQLQMASDETDNDKVKLTPIRAWVLNVPLLKPEDVMCDILNQRYKVVNVAPRTKSQYVIRQILDLVPLDKGHPAYQIEVDRMVD
jgi:hypothetical protein